MRWIQRLELSRRGFMRLVGAAAAAAVARPLAGCGDDGGATGMNTNIDHGILVDDAMGYNGRWAGDWNLDGAGKKGTVAGVVTIDPDARTLKVDLSFDGDLLQDGTTLAPFTVSGSVDSFIYTDDGEFQITKQTPLGNASIVNGASIGSGKFVLHIDIAGHAGVQAFDAQGVANRGGVIPTTFTITKAGGAKLTGNIMLATSG